jgi:hypothetical protein
LVSVGAGFVLLAGGTAAGAAIAGPIDGGVIHGCYYRANNAGAHTLVLQDVGTKCPNNTTAIQWNQTGQQGPQGNTGTAGPPGADGNTVLSGTGGPSDSLGNAGDFYLDTAASVLYGPKTASGWPSAGTSLIGPQGPRGSAAPICTAPAVPGVNYASCVIFRDLSNVNLDGANLAHADLASVNLVNTSLVGANLGGADLVFANLSNANGAGANVAGVLWGDTRCPDLTNSDDDGDTCVGHGF